MHWFTKIQCRFVFELSNCLTYLGYKKLFIDVFMTSVATKIIIYRHLNKLEATPSKFYSEYWRLSLASRLDHDKCGQFLQSHSLLISLYCYFHPAIKNRSINMAHQYQTYFNFLVGFVNLSIVIISKAYLKTCLKLQICMHRW